MKKLLFLLVMATSLMFTSCTKECINADVAYTNVNVYNGWGNVVDFQMSYDNCDQCTNNFNIVNNTQYQVFYNFNIYQNGYIVYTGYFNVAPYNSIYFNNAFTNCNSSSALTEVVIW